MADWSKYPFVRMLIPFAMGIWCYVCLPSLQLSFVVLICSALALLGLSVVTSLTLRRQRFAWLFGAVMACYLFMAGYALTRVHEVEGRRDYYRNFESDANYYVARIYDCPTERDNSIRAVLALEYQFGDNAASRPVSGKVMAYFPKSDSAFTLRYGDLVAIPAPVREVSGPKNPGEFNYRDYLSRKGITGQVYLRDDDWLDLQVNNANPLFAFSFRFRDMLLASLRKCGLKNHEFGVAAAILLGYDDYLEHEMRQKYVASGSMHILCVSGLHVGIIFLVASFLLGFLDRKRWQKALKHGLLLALIWFYALIAGLSLSILRSALMLSFVIIGEAIRRKGFVINSISASAFILLCVNPNNLFEIGFLLSYAAVVGIVVLQKPIYNWLYFKNKLLDKVWEITSVALSAQIATIPFTLFYFNQFTTYFWLSNLFMTPISFIVVMGGMLLLLVSWIPYVNVLFGYLVWGMIYVMNFLVSWVDSLPYSIVKGLYISSLEFVLLLLAFVLLLLCMGLHKRRLFIGMLSSLLLVAVSVTVRLYKSDYQKGMTVYSLRNHTAIDYVSGRDHILLADSSLMSDVSAVDYSLSGAWAKRNLSAHPQVVGLDEDFDGACFRKRQNLVSFNGKLLAFWEGTRYDDSLSYRLPVDYLIVANSTNQDKYADLQSVIKAYDVKMIVVDGSMPRYLAEKWMAQADELHLPCHYIGDCALQIDFDSMR